MSFLIFGSPFRPQRTGISKARSEVRIDMPVKGLALERAVDELEGRIKEKIATKTGFADNLRNARELENWFKFYDIKSSGYISYDQFLNSMIKLNIVGFNRECESLFSRYDDTCTDHFNYRDVAYNLFGVGKSPTMDKEAKTTFYTLKKLVVDRSGSNGFYGIFNILKNFTSSPSSYIVNRYDVEDSLNASGIDSIQSDKLQKVLEFFIKKEIDPVGVNVLAFVNCLKTGMNLERMRLLKSVFSKLDPLASGFVDSNYLKQNFNPGPLSNVPLSYTSAEEAAQRMEEADALNYTPNEGYVSFPAFLDFFKCLSPCVVDDTFFEAIVNGIFQQAVGASTTVKRVAVIKRDGSVQVVEVHDGDLDNLDGDAIIDVMQNEYGIRDIAEIRL